MKKILFLLGLVGITFMGCNPLEDINNDLDAQANPVVGTADYTLTADDYAALGLGFGTFDSEDQAKDSIPQLLAEMYPYWGQGSSVNVEYDLYIGSAQGISDLTSATTYSLTSGNYAATGSDVLGFYPDVNATNEIPEFLEAAFSSPEEGQTVLVTYNHYTEVPEVGIADLETFDFNESLEGFENISEEGDDQVWENGSFGGVEYAIMSGYDEESFANDDWLISPEIDLEDETNVSLQINQAINFADDVSLLSVLVSSDYTTGGDVSSATWDVVDFEISPVGNSWDFVLSENYDLSDYDDETVHVALRYVSTIDDASTWEIDQLLVKALGVTGDYDSKGEYFTYTDGSWEVTDNAYYLSSADYDSMGESSGQPGQYDNFSSGAPADNYLSTFLGIEFPFAQEEDEIFVIYKYFSGGISTRGDLYTFTNGMWVRYESTTTTSLQFGFDNGVWVPDNTIRYALGPNEYATIAAALSDAYPSATASMGQYNNMDRREGNPNEWTNAMILEAINVIMEDIDPSAEEDQKYVITIDVYNGSNTTEDFAVIKTGGEWVYQE